MHIPVLLEPAVRLWASLDEHDIVKAGIYIDATFGEGGHSNYLLKYPKKENFVVVVGLDRDPEQYRKSNDKYRNSIEERKLFLYNDSFTNISKIISSFQKKYRIKLPLRGVLFDFGIATTHLSSSRGFSFRAAKDPLDMRFNPEKTKVTAADILNGLHEKELAKIFFEFGEERYARRAARAIARARKQGKRYSAVEDLLEVLEKTMVSVYRKQKIHFATRIFQALRIAVNNEFGNIEEGLEKTLGALDRNGRIVAISFHSGEDRIVKNLFRRESKDCVCKINLPRCVCRHRKSLRIITRKPLTPDAEEIRKNPNSRSAKLRAAEKII